MTGRWGDPCFVPPGRAWAIEHCLPIIPRPQWARYVRTGRFNNGIQRGLDETAACHVNEAVVVDGRVLSGSELPHGPIPGIFPPGWYRHCVDESEAPPDPVETTRAFELERLRPRGPIIIGDAPDDELRCFPPSIDMLVPLPLRAGSFPWPRPDGSIELKRAEVGDWGSIVVRIPGWDQPMFASGSGWGFIAREWLSPEGLAYLETANRAREQGHPRAWSTAMIERTWVQTLWGARSGTDVQIPWWTRDYAHSHLACARPRGANYYHHESLGPVGEPIPSRWRLGGESPAPWQGEGWDVYEEMYQNAFGAGWAQHPLSFVDAEGRDKVAASPEAAYAAPGTGDSYRDEWVVLADGSASRTPRPWPGPPPGAFLPQSSSTEQVDTFSSSGGHPTLGGLGCGRPPRMAGFFDSIVDIVKAPIEFAGDVVGEAAGFAESVAGEVWEHLPSEVRQLAMQYGPAVAGTFLPAFGDTAASAALQILEGGRQADRAERAMRQAIEAGRLPSINVRDPVELAAVARAADAPVARATRVSHVAEEPSAAGGLATSGGLLALLAAL